MKILRSYGWVALVVVVAAALYLHELNKAVPAQLGKVSSGPIEEYVTEEAETQLEVERVIAADRAGTIQRIELEEGDPVGRGQTITKIEDAQLGLIVGKLEDSLAEVRARLSGADVTLPKPSQLEAADQEVERAKLDAEALGRSKDAAGVELRYAAEEADRFTALYEKGAATKRERDDADRKHETAKARAEELDRRLAAAQVAVQIARLNRETLRKSMEDTAYLHDLYEAQAKQLQKVKALLLRQAVVKSPIDGVVLQKYLDSRQFVQPGARLLRVGEPSSIEIRADILSDEVGRVCVGQKVLLEGPALGGASPQARIKKIYPSGFTKMSSLGVREQRVPVLIEFDNSEVNLGSGYELDVKIAVARKERAVLVPGDAVFAAPKGAAVFVVEEGKARLRNIKTGLAGEEYYEVLEGLKEGETVVLRPPTELEDGARVAQESDSAAQNK